MLSWSMVESLGLHSGLINSVRERASSGHYSDAIMAGFRYLTDVLRDKSGMEGDGAQLAGQAFGGSTPPIRINALRTASEKDEQKGLEQLVRGLYICVRNPRAHDDVEDTEDFFVRVILMIDTILGYLDREISAFDVGEFVDRIFDPHFVPSAEYADAWVRFTTIGRMRHAWIIPTLNDYLACRMSKHYKIQGRQSSCREITRILSKRWARK